MDKAYYSTDELAERLCVHKQTLQNWRQKGIGPQFLKIGRRVIYSVIDVQAWENERKRQNTVYRGSGLHPTFDPDSDHYDAQERYTS